MKYNECPGIKFWGLLECKLQWSLTLEAWLVLIVVSLFVLVTTSRALHGFFACNEPVKAEVLVVEGWITDDAVLGAMEEFYRGDYQILVTIGLPLPKGYYLSQYKDFAQLTAATLKALGFPEDKLVALPAGKSDRDRTNACAEVVKGWLETQVTHIKGINVYSGDIHTRRSRLVYRRVMGKGMSVGAIAHPTNYYDPQRWWAYSGGVKLMIVEIISYGYELCNSLIKPGFR